MYRTIDTATWNDPKFRALAPDAKLLFIYLFTNSHSHVSGIYYLPSHMMAHETGLKVQRVDTLLDTLSKSGMAHWDRVSEVIWVTKMFDRQGRGAKNNTSAASQLTSLHNCPLIKDFLQFYAHRKIPYTIPYRYPIQNLPYQEQDQDQEQEQEQEQEAKAASPHRPTLAEVSAYCLERGNAVDASRFMDHYSANGWRVGKNPMKDWKAAVRTWEKNDFGNGSVKNKPIPQLSDDP